MFVGTQLTDFFQSCCQVCIRGENSDKNKFESLSLQSYVMNFHSSAVEKKDFKECDSIVLFRK